MSTEAETERPNPNINAFSAAVGCYPIISQLVHCIDLNTLHALSRTCRQIRANLLQYRGQLVRQTLRCSNEELNARIASRKNDSTRWNIRGGTNLLTSGKVSPCARDMVSDCRSCGQIICRNCAHKPPSPSALPNRLRRLCTSCLAAPASHLTTRAPCTCVSAIYFCQPCGAPLATSDTTYKRVWTWRTLYSKLGTGIGEGNEGVKCWRGEQCLAAEFVEVEVECSTAEEEEECGYWRQEVEGIGGVVRRKVRRRSKVGAPMREWEDEREGADEILGREKRGRERAWCGWCERVVLGGCDLEEGAECWKASGV